VAATGGIIIPVDAAAQGVGLGLKLERATTRPIESQSTRGMGVRDGGCGGSCRRGNGELSATNNKVGEGGGVVSPGRKLHSVGKQPSYWHGAAVTQAQHSRSIDMYVAVRTGSTNSAKIYGAIVDDRWAAVGMHATAEAVGVVADFDQGEHAPGALVVQQRTGESNPVYTDRGNW